MMSPISRYRWFGPAAALILAGCATTSPQEKAAYAQAQHEVQRLQADPLASEAAAKPLADARIDLSKADAASKNHMTDDAIHWSYLATREAQIGQAMTSELRARRQIAQASQKRNQIVLEAQRHRAEMAESEARDAQRRAQQAEQEVAQLKQQRQSAEADQRIADAQQRAQSAAQRAEEARQKAEQANQTAQQAQQQAQDQIATARRQAQQAQQQVAQAREETQQARQQEEQARQQLEAIQAHETDRGMVIVLGDSVLFATGKDTIEPGALSTLRRIAQFLHEHPKEKLRVEGYTDDRGSDATNDALSQRRAEAVAKALQAEGVDPSRLETIGRGSSLPVASNDSAAGRQQNRRVELVFSNAAGQFSRQLAEAPH